MAEAPRATLIRMLFEGEGDEARWASRRMLRDPSAFLEEVQAQYRARAEVAVRSNGAVPAPDLRNTHIRSTIELLK